MLLSREETRFEIGPGRLDPERDREILGWIFSQALFGEATGCYCGAALYTAPDIESATFLSRQAVEEFAHFHNFLRIFRMLGTRPQPPHPVLRFLTSHERLWDHHVALEMAVGEGLVLVAFEALEQAIEHDGIRAILRSVAEQERGHVAFGEQQTLKVLRERPGRRAQLLGRALVTLLAVRLLARRITRSTPAGHPLAGDLPRLLEHAISVTELRLRRLGLLDRPLAEIGRPRRAVLMARGLSAAFLRGLFAPRRPVIPRRYLDDPVVERILSERPDAGTAVAGGRPAAG